MKGIGVLDGRFPDLGGFLWSPKYCKPSIASLDRDLNWLVNAFIS